MTTKTHRDLTNSTVHLIFLTGLLIFLNILTGCSGIKATSEIRKNEQRWYETHGLEEPQSFKEETRIRGIGIGTEW